MEAYTIQASMLFELHCQIGFFSFFTVHSEQVFIHLVIYVKQWSNLNETYHMVNRGFAVFTYMM
jgi:hypothetical protein